MYSKIRHISKNAAEIIVATHDERIDRALVVDLADEIRQAARDLEVRVDQRYDDPQVRRDLEDMLRALGALAETMGVSVEMTSVGAYDGSRDEEIVVLETIDDSESDDDDDLDDLDDEDDDVDYDDDEV
jgi:hypothetical protein